MRIRLPFVLSLLASFCLVWSACGSSAGPVKKAEQPCEALAALLEQVRGTETALAEGQPWSACTAQLKPLLAGLRDHMGTDTSECYFLNMRKFPDQDRLLFIDLLRDRTETDTLVEGIYYLLRLRGLFEHDHDISEYLSEELAHVALVNPHCFQGYLRANPDQEVMLLYSTKWNPLDHDTLIQRFQRIDSSSAVIPFLLNTPDDSSILE